MNAIVEITDRNDLEKVSGPAEYLGVNSRDLETLKVDTKKFETLRPFLPDSFLIAESGIADLTTLSRVQQLGYHGALIGEHLLRATDPGQELAKFVRHSRIPKVKICGITNEADAFGAIEAGAQALGFIFAKSPRRIDPRILRTFRGRIPDNIVCAGVFKGRPCDCVRRIVNRFELDVAQIYDPMDLETETWQAQIVSYENQVSSQQDRSSVNKILWDVKTEESQLPEMWSALSQQPVFALAGGLHPGNVAQAVEICHPQWVDVARGVEKEPGIKDPAKMRAFVNALYVSGDRCNS
jgi:phosphoribosylanthranilate isomerase